jgi:hypothetical protein
MGLTGLACGPIFGAVNSAIIFPSGSTIADNLLRVELQFAFPLRAPLDMRHVYLLDDVGNKIEKPFLDLPLPSADGLRVALLMHPGRVKSGVGLNSKLGRALKAATSVTLVVDDPAIGSRLEKTWKVVDADLSAPVPKSWSLSTVTKGTRTPLSVGLDSPVSATALGLIAVRGTDGKPFEGLATLSDQESTWRFTPKHPWTIGHYALMVHPDLEDPSGNRACMPWEVKGTSHKACESGTVIVFSVGARVAHRRLPK